MAIENFASNYFWSIFHDSINVFDGCLSSVITVFIFLPSLCLSSEGLSETGDVQASLNIHWSPMG